MYKTLTLISFMLFSAISYAEPFTILAKSGLNVRKEPVSTAEKIGNLPFGTIVEAEMNYGSDTDYFKRHVHFSEIIEGKRGFWVKITHGKIKGYIFSGFGLVGDWVVKSSDINNDYRILHTGQYCDPINYDPKLNWYALTKSKGKLSLTKTEVTLRLIHEFNENDTLGKQNDSWASFPIVVQTNQKDTVLYLIGSKTTLAEGEISAPFVAQKPDFDNKEMFLFPEQTYEFFCGNKTYKFRAFENVRLAKDNPEGYVKNYQIEIGTDNPGEKRYNLSQELQLEKPAARHCIYKTPLLVLVGDINKDGLPDFIYYSRTMTDSCGVCWEHHLFISNTTNPGQPFRKVAHELNCNCIS